MRLADIIEPSEIAKLNCKSDWQGWRILISNLLMIAGAFTLATLLPWWLGWPLALILLGGRQLGLAILMHDCSHNGLFATKELNPWVGKWFCAAPVMIDLDRYRDYHLRHHRTSGSDEDPDRPNYLPYPVSRASALRKAVRDLTGVTGIKNAVLLIKMNSGAIAYQLSYADRPTQEKPPIRILTRNLAMNLTPTLVSNGLLLTVLWVLGRPELFLLWPLAWMTTYQLFSRIRNAAEHAACPDMNSPDPFLHTRTYLVGPLARLTLAPNYVNYHLEHHVLESVPPYNLPKLHQALSKAGVLDRCDIRNGMQDLFRVLVQAQ